MPTQPAPCPHCAVTMRAVHARARSGYCLLLDQCPRCGGVWCDRWELYPLDAGEAQRIDAVDPQHLQEPGPPPLSPGRCPRCTVALRPFRDPALPPDARIERCGVCDGMWLNRGELRRVKQRAVRPPLSGDAALLARIGAQLGASRTWSEVGNLDAATYASDPNRDDSGAAAPAALAGNAWSALAGLLQLLR